MDEHQPLETLDDRAEPVRRCKDCDKVIEPGQESYCPDFCKECWADGCAM